MLVLDIGTHKILGLAVRPAGEGVEILASSMARHRDRAMRDGQVHDVRAVARSIRAVVDELERATGARLRGARVAAAGRALKTSRGRAEAEHAAAVTLSAEGERSLVWEAVADAQHRLAEGLAANELSRGYYAIAHAVTACWLDGDLIGNLAGQRGRSFALEALATFLPAAVVDSLESALEQAGLEMTGLTLEPIAALEAVIPPTARHLQLALVDIGAGTSDIVITGGGRVEAFAMVPQAGDAITEAVSHALLLDFAVAEQLKREASRGQRAVAEDVLGQEVTLDPQALAEIVREPVQKLAESIAQEILQWAPGGLDAVILVGGGSQTPGLPEALAAFLGMPKGRVAVRDRRAVRHVAGAEHLAGPDAVTALGIALRGVRGEEMPPVRVRVNGRPVCLFLPDRCTVREAARVAGLSPADLVGRMGPGMTVTVNGEILVIPGSRGEPAVARIGGEVVSFDTLLHNLDEVVIEPPKPGLPARPTVAEVVERWLSRAQDGGMGGAAVAVRFGEGARTRGVVDAGGAGGVVGEGGAAGAVGSGSASDTNPRARQPALRPRLRLNGQWQEAPVWVRKNGRPAKMDEAVADRDVFEIRWPRTARELLEALGEAQGSAGRCLVQGREVFLGEFLSLRRNGEPATLSDPVQDGDTWEWESLFPPTAGELLERLGIAGETTLEVTVNGQPVTLRLPAKILLNGRPADPSVTVGDGDRLEVQPVQSLSLYELLPYAGISWEERIRDGRRLVLEVRGEPADFTTSVSPGDVVAIRFE